jgi:hypothetical protein
MSRVDFFKSAMAAGPASRAARHLHNAPIRAITRTNAGDVASPGGV